MQDLVRNATKYEEIENIKISDGFGTIMMMVSVGLDGWIGIEALQCTGWGEK